MPAALAVARLVSVPVTVGLTATRTTFTSPGASVPSAQLTDPVQPSADTRSTPPGSVSASVTPLTLSGPLLRATNAYSSGDPAVPGLGAAVLASTDRSPSEYAS